MTTRACLPCWWVTCDDRRQFAVVLAAIFIGARMGGIAIGIASGLGVLVLALLGLKPGDTPLDSVSVIVASRRCRRPVTWTSSIWPIAFCAGTPST